MKASFFTGSIVGVLAFGIACTTPPGPPKDDEGHSHEHGELGWYFGADSEANVWRVTVVDAGDPDEARVRELDELAALSGSAGNDAGPGWGDAIVSSDGARIFVNATSINKLAVFEVATGSLEAVLDVGARPVHLYNPNHGDEIWTHADGEGAFYVVDQHTLAQTGPIVAALGGTGHGKLAYASELGTRYYATNTNDPGAFVIDGAGKTDGVYIALCGVPCDDDPNSTCGGTHDKAYNPRMNWAVFQCSGASGGHYAFVDASTNEVVHDLVELSGGVANTPDNAYILVFGGESVRIWDTDASAHDGLSFDATLMISDHPSDRGTEFRRTDDGSWEAWIPQNQGTKVIVVDLGSYAVEEIEIGGLTAPPGAGHFSRRSAMGADYFFNTNDQGVVMVDVHTHERVQGPAVGAVGAVARVVAVEHEHAH